ncbi:hypothetical protein N7512_003536 [Penicillium capsulatum]|nr:hypothetical protein N7512_003536 [Penicillium capsulatum]
MTGESGRILIVVLGTILMATMAVIMTMDPSIRAYFGEPPAGIDLTESRVGVNNGAVIAMLSLAVVAVLLRFMARSALRNGFKADDWLAIGSLLFLGCSASLSIAGGEVDAGKHVWIVTKEKLELIYKYLFAYTFTYAACCTCTRLSILFFYHRVFSPMEPWLKWITLFGWFLTITYPISMWVTMATSCQPVPYFWTQYTGGKGTCINETKFFLATAVINMLSDFIICLIPIPRIAQLQMKPKKKFAICAILAVGLFACFASVVRIYYISIFMRGPDATWDMGPVFIWSTIEPAIALACACMPHLTPLAKAAHQSVVSSFSTQKSKFSSSSSSSSKPHVYHRSGSSRSGPGARRSIVFGSRGPTFESRTEAEDEIGLTNCVEVGTKDKAQFYGSDDQLPQMGVHVHSSIEQTTSKY